MATELLERAFAEASKRTEQEQEACATLILEELASAWHSESALAESDDALARLADGALVEHRTGQTRELEPDGL